MQRLTDAQMTAAYNMLIGNATDFGKCFAPDKPFVYCDDPDQSQW